ncbi:MAG TPA: hypothetical protein VHM48_11780 [Candidatus Limnocylindrales bacterium]|nr:hypothetical protein [Candidatus Limnocylindrales bacterium]
MDRRVAQGRSPLASDPPPSTLFVSIAVGAALVAIALVVYTLSHPYRLYNHFEWQALAFLEGQAAIRYPVEATATSPGNAFFQDVLPVSTSRGLIPFPPLPAVLLMPFVALWGLAANGQLVFAILGAVDVGIAWWMLGRLPIRTWVRVATTLFLGFGTVFWYAAQIGTTWYQAHVLAVGLALAAIGVAIGADRDAARSEDDLDDAGAPVGAARTRFRLGHVVPDARQFLAGLLFGLACTSRLTVAFAAPFFVLVGSGGSWQRRGWSAALGAGIPIGLLIVYNVVSTGHVFNPGYQYLYELEAGFYTQLNYHIDWQIEDLRYLPQNFGIMFLNGPVWLPTVVPSALDLGGPLCTDPAAVRGLFNPDCPLVLPKDTGMSILLTSPAYLLALPALRWGFGLSRLVTAASLAVLIVAFVNLLHFSQGWVQFGYRFSLDFAPWAILLVAVGLERIAARTGPRDVVGPSWPGAGAIRGGATAPLGRAGAGAAYRVGARALVALAVALVVGSVLVNFWGVVWGDVLGW